MDFRKTSGLQKLPYEIMAYIVRDLEIGEIFDLSRCCRHFQYLVREESFCKAIVTAKAWYTAEAQQEEDSGHFSRALRRLAKRRQAFSQASPYVVGIVAFADSYQYICGKLCYIINERPRRWLRILDLHGSKDTEVIIDIPTLISLAVPRSAKSRKYRFRTLYHAHGITSCLFSFALPRTENWLLIFKHKEQVILEAVRLNSTSKIFVRNNAQFLYFGTHSEEGTDGFRKWVIEGFDIKKRIWLSPKMHLSDLVGCDMGSTVCFEIFDGHFYGLSNQTAFEIEEIDWVSHYYCFRFRLEEPDPKKAQVMKREDSWRRQHSEGPIDDRWGFLALEKDETSGGIRIVESRKEWLAGQSGSRRTYYTKEVVFGEYYGENTEETRLAANDAVQGENVANFIGSISRAEQINPQPRLPSEMHAGDDSSGTSIVTRSRTYLCSYQRCCHTFLDMMDDTCVGDAGPQCLRIRTGHRKSRPISSPAGALIPSESSLDLDDKVKQLYQENEIYIWPPRRASYCLDPCSESIYQVLNPPDHQGYVAAVGDERSIVYATGENAKGLKALVYISFDPAAKLSGMSHGGNLLGQMEKISSHGGAEQPMISEGVKTSGIPQSTQDVTSKDKSKAEATTHGYRGSIPPYVSPILSRDRSSRHTSQNTQGDPVWAWTDKAMYQDILGKQFTFALGKWVC
ncbi:Uu.00g102110.m01.CDS01 [Anthostomella pinea]|uniref:Uu.00g102110.m01.CDS01 n=1 Tax=Anthostomella pinea TaxID=933095 RepID=A0AAI8YFD8_9PEZI|nr:Uu.00g102110.m01.CDS01 [Anthostomella pinea]